MATCRHSVDDEDKIKVLKENEIRKKHKIDRTITFHRNLWPDEDEKFKKGIAGKCLKMFEKFENWRSEKISINRSVTDNLKARDASASKNLKRK